MEASAFRRVGSEVFPLISELAKGLEPSTTCLQDRCATNCATPAGPDDEDRDRGIVARGPGRHRVVAPVRGRCC